MTPWPARSMRTGKPVLLDEQSLKKIKTDYLVYSLVYVPLKAHDRVVGVLGVDNRDQKKAFTDYHVRLLSAVADFAGIAIENARLFSGTNDELNRLETILTKVQDGVIILDTENKIVFVNQGAREALSLDGKRPDRKTCNSKFAEPTRLSTCCSVAAAGRRSIWKKAG